jgi:hypothetical protein
VGPAQDLTPLELLVRLGKAYLELGRFDEAERLARVALPYVTPRPRALPPVPAAGFRVEVAEEIVDAPPVVQVIHDPHWYGNQAHEMAEAAGPCKGG